jgi:hypothetical protein
MYFTDEQINRIEGLFEDFLKGMPEISIDKREPSVIGVDIDDSHAYIKESFSNYLEQVPKSDSDYDLVLPINTKEDYHLTMNVADQRLDLTIAMRNKEELSVEWKLNSDESGDLSISDTIGYEMEPNEAVIEFSNSAEFVKDGKSLFLNKEWTTIYIAGLDLEIHANDVGVSLFASKNNDPVYSFRKSYSELMDELSTQNDSSFSPR